MKNTKEENISKILMSSEIVAIKLFQVNENYFKIPNTQQWLIDGGIQFTFSDEYFTVGWNQDKAHFVYESKKFSEVYSDDNFTELSEESNTFSTVLKGNQITNIDYIWREFQVIEDYKMNIKKEQHIVALKVEFNTNDFLIISTINYNLEEHQAPKNFRYEIANDLLISLNTIPQILA